MEGKKKKKNLQKKTGAFSKRSVLSASVAIQPSKKTVKNPRIRIAKTPSFSPFVIHLNEEVSAPMDIINEQTTASVSFNFLVSEHELARDHFLQETVMDELVLLKEDISHQLNERDHYVEPHGHAALRGVSSQPVIPESPIPIPSEQPTSSALPAFELSWPEMEDGEEDESEILVLEDLEAAAEFTRPPAPALTTPRRSWRPSFHWPSFKWTLSPGWRGSLAGFILASFLVVFPLHAMDTIGQLQQKKSRLETISQEAVAAIQASANAVQNKNLSKAGAYLDEAQGSFRAAGMLLTNMNRSTAFLLSLLPRTQNTYESGKYLFQAGDQLSQAAQRMTAVFTTIGAHPDLAPTEKLRLFSSETERILTSLKEAERAIEKVDETVLLEKNREIFLTLKTSLPTVIDSLETFTQLSGVLENILGGSEPRRYLVILQNNGELRPTGGFMGSFVELTFEKGKIIDMHLPPGGTYDLQGSIRTSLAAPEPLRLINPRFEFQDANWFVDFPTSARHILDVYADTGGPTVDGVIAVNASVMVSLLKELGPIELPSYQKTFDADHFIDEAQQIAESDYVRLPKDPNRKEAAPKAFLGELAPEVLKRIEEKPPEALLSILDVFENALNKKDIQCFFLDPELAKAATEWGWDGTVHQTDGDYLLITNTNIGGGKTDRVIIEEVRLDVNILEDGHIINTLEITRTHPETPNDPYANVNNVNYLRVYVPNGSILLNASGFTPPPAELFEKPDSTWKEDADIAFFNETIKTDERSGTVTGEEFGKTVFGNWTQTNVGESSTATFVYELPFTLDNLHNNPSLLRRMISTVTSNSLSSYALELQKQSGADNRKTTVQVHIPPSFERIWSSVEGEKVPFLNTTDHAYSILLESL